jgi:phage shock protein PspC (stress-responsive transcriptional regulator)
MTSSKSFSLGNRVFLFEDTAYYKFESYYSSIKNHFLRFSNGEEKLKDIEFDIADSAEKMLSELKTILNTDDVENIIKFFAYSKNWEKKYGLNDSEYSQKRSGFYRNSNDKVLSGFCASCADYINVDRFIFRLLFAILAIFLPILIIVYIVAWVLFPESDDSKSFSLNEFGKKARPFVASTTTVFVKILGIVLLIFSVSSLSGFIVAFKFLTDFFSDFDVQLMIFHGSQNNLFLLSFSALIVLPFVLLLLISIKLIWDNSIPKYTFSTIIISWFVSVFVIAFSIITILPEFEYSTSYTEDFKIVVTDDKPLTIEFNDFSDYFNFDLLEINYVFLAGDSKDLVYKVNKISRGSDRGDARKNADNIQYFFDIKENRIQLNQFFGLNNNVYRAQELEISIYLPNNKPIYIDNYNHRYIKIRDMEYRRRILKRKNFTLTNQSGTLYIQ